jgi:guanylate kinase
MEGLTNQNDMSKVGNAHHTSAVPKLQHREEFEKILRTYKMSEAASRVLAKTPFVLMVAATAAGRNTIIGRLLASGDYHSIVSDTTRPMRTKDGKPVEAHGVEYFFRDEEDVLQDLREGKFIEAAIIHRQQVSGVSVREVEKAFDTGKIAITDIEVQGCETIMRIKPNAIPIFVLPPNFKEWLRRLHSRSNLSQEEIHNRLETAIQELEIALNDDRFTFVINDDLDDAVHIVDDVAKRKHHKREEQQARMLAQRLREDAVEYLAEHTIRPTK